MLPFWKLEAGLPERCQGLLKKSVECWNADKFEGVAGGPTKDNICYQRQLDHGIKIVDVYVGSDSSQQLPSEYFDLVYSISVIEHLDRNAIVDCFKECKRILKPGGRMYHAIDYFLDVEIYEDTHNKIENLRFAAEVAGFAPIGDDEVGQHPTFKSKYATPSDFFLSANWCHVKSLKNLVEKLSLVSLVSGHIKA